MATADTILILGVVAVAAIGAAWYFGLFGGSAQAQPGTYPSLQDPKIAQQFQDVLKSVQPRSQLGVPGTIQDRFNEVVQAAKNATGAQANLGTYYNRLLGGPYGSQEYPNDDFRLTVT